METKRVFRIILLFIFLYLIVGFIYPYILNAVKINIRANYAEFSIYNNTLFDLFVWPYVFLVIGRMGGGLIWILIPIFLLLFLVWLAYYIDKLFLSK